MRPVNRPTAASSPPGACRTWALSDPMALATVAPRPTPATATIASAARWLGVRPARCAGRGRVAGAGGGGIDWRGSARAVTEDYFGTDTPRNEGDEEIHTGVLRCGPIQQACQPSGRPPRSVACSRYSPPRPASASVPPRWRNATGMNYWSVPLACVPRLSAPRHRTPQAACRRRSRSRSPTARQSPHAGQSRSTHQPRRSPTARRQPPPRRPRLPPRPQRRPRPSPRSRRKHPRPRFNRRRRLPSPPLQRPPQSSPAGPKWSGPRVSRRNQAGALASSHARLTDLCVWCRTLTSQWSAP